MIENDCHSNFPTLCTRFLCGPLMNVIYIICHFQNSFLEPESNSFLNCQPNERYYPYYKTNSSFTAHFLHLVNFFCNSSLTTPPHTWNTFPLTRFPMCSFSFYCFHFVLFVDQKSCVIILKRHACEHGEYEEALLV